MKKLLTLSTLALMLAACSDSASDSKTVTSTNSSNVTPETNTPKTEPSTAATTISTTVKQDSLLEDVIANMTLWESYVSMTEIVEEFENSELYPTIEYNIEKQYIVEPTSVYVATSTIGFSNMFYEQYADNAYIEGGYESMDQGEWIEMEHEAVEATLKNQLYSRAELLKFLEQHSEITTDPQLSFTINELELVEAYKKMQMTLFYNVTDAEVTSDIEEAIFIDMGELIAGVANVTIVNDQIEQFSLTFDYTNEAGEVNRVTATETYSRVNEIDLVDSPEELYIGVGVN